MGETELRQRKQEKSEDSAKAAGVANAKDENKVKIGINHIPRWERYTGTPKILAERISTDEGEAFQQPIFDGTMNPSITMFKRNIAKSLFCAITYNTLSLWSIKVNVTNKAGSADFKTEGDNVDLIWKPDGNTIVVITNRGYVHYYDVVNQQAPMLDFIFAGVHHHSRGPGEEEGVPGYYLKFNISLEVESGIDCGIGLKDELILCTNQDPSLINFTWTAEKSVAKPSKLSDLEFYHNPAEPILLIRTNKTEDLYGILTETGYVYLCQYDKKWTGVCIYSSQDNPPATSLEFNPSFNILAIGNLGGMVYHYEIKLNPLTSTLTHTSAIMKPDGRNTPMKLSAISSMSWSSDGYALAVSWIYGGFSVWSIYGCLLTSTISEDTYVHASDGIVNETEEVFFTGVQELWWAPGDYFLFILPSTTLEKDIVLDLYVIEFAKSSILTSLSNQHNRNVCLVASDRLIVYEGMDKEEAVMGLDPLNWTTIHIPPMYLVANWPIKYVTSSRNSQFIAIAGRKGFAHYNNASGKWKLFGNEHHEQGFEVRLYSRDAKLDEDNIIHTEVLSHPISAMNLLDSHLLVFTKNSSIQSYIIHQTAGIS
ncbi:hypothetical protein HDV01_000067 [Terramyces sp. JEL0728]|nr:hypothetical protein HDV01_000067 [Terramyces sp. JEL0728]